MVNLINKKVKHTGALGIGIVTEQDDKYITVQFANKVIKFVYPAAFEKWEYSSLGLFESVNIYENDGYKASYSGRVF